ncbi:hypothetical protein OG978_07685 [Streptomyces sp. NBC_01591]|nr:hypothetical protein [Streptomyces sp. NBC_01591]WSD67275.1 hypothetical protein OG978_07685 [Streptomyces sp. NBC_01591]
MASVAPAARTVSIWPMTHRAAGQVARPRGLSAYSAERTVLS